MHEVAGALVEHHVEADIGVIGFDDRQPDATVVVGAALRSAQGVVEKCHQRLALRLVRQHIRQVVARLGQPVFLEAAAASDQANGGGEVTDIAQIARLEAHGVFLRSGSGLMRSNGWRAMVRICNPASVAVRPTGMSPAPSTSRPLSAASAAATPNKACQASAVSASPQIPAMPNGPRGADAHAAPGPERGLELPIATGTCTIARRTWSERTGIATMMTRWPKRRSIFATSTSNSLSPSRSRMVSPRAGFRAAS